MGYGPRDCAAQGHSGSLTLGNSAVLSHCERKSTFSRTSTEFDVQDPGIDGLSYECKAFFLKALGFFDISQQVCDSSSADE